MRIPVLLLTLLLAFNLTAREDLRRPEFLAGLKSGTSAFGPATVPGLAFWLKPESLKANDTLTHNLTNGAFITNWVEATTGVSNIRTWSTNVVRLTNWNGNNAIYSSAQISLTCPYPISPESNNFVFFFVHIPFDTNSITQTFFDASVTDQIYCGWDGNALSANRLFSWWPHNITAQGPQPLKTAQCTCYQFGDTNFLAGSTNGMSIYTNNVTCPLVGNGTTRITKYILPGGGNQWFAGNAGANFNGLVLGEVMIYTNQGVMQPADMKTIYTYLATKWGLPASP